MRKGLPSIRLSSMKSIDQRFRMYVSVWLGE
jgi:hypothetical protein